MSELKYIKSAEEALEYLKNDILLLRQKAETVNPTIKQLLSYTDVTKKFDILTYNITSINDNGQYDRTSWNINYDYLDIGRLEVRLKILESIPEHLEEIRLKNEAIIAHNKVVRDNVVKMMKQIGIKDTYSERDHKSRARTPKTITYNAGYLGDISRNIPLNDTGYNQLISRINQLKSDITRSINEKIKKLTEEQQEKKRLEEERYKTNVLAALRVKYNLDYDAPIREIHSAIISADRYYVLGNLVHNNASDLDNFIKDMTPFDEQDEEIIESISNILKNGDNPARGKWNRAELMKLVNPEVINDLNNCARFMG